MLGAGGLEASSAEHEDALARARSAYAGLAASPGRGSDVDVAILTVGIQLLRVLCHAVGA